MANRAEKYFALAIDKAVANTIDPARFPIGSGTLEAVLLERLKRVPSANLKKNETREQIAKAQADRLADAQQRWRERYAATGRFKPGNRQYQRYLGTLASTVRLDSAEPIGAQLPLDHFFGGCPRLVERAKQLAKPLDNAVPKSKDAYKWIRDIAGLVESTRPPAPAKTTLECVIREVNCIKETDGFLWTAAGDDEIKLGGLKVSPRGAVEKRPAFHVKDFEQDGDVETYPPPNYKQFADFSLLDQGAWPRPFFATFVLAEADMGGLGEFLSSLVDLVQTQIAAELATATGVPVATIVVTVLGPGVVAAAIALALMLIVFVVVLVAFDEIKKVWKDDIFKPQTLMFSIDSQTAANSLDWVSENLWGSLNFLGHGGHYQLYYSWRCK